VFVTCFPSVLKRSQILGLRPRTCTTFSQHCFPALKNLENKELKLGKTFLTVNLDNYSNKILFFFRSHVPRFENRRQRKCRKFTVRLVMVFLVVLSYRSTLIHICILCILQNFPSNSDTAHHVKSKLNIKYHSRFFVRVGHETTHAAIGNHHFFTIPCPRHTY
jgi:hypothetical protein